MTKFFQDRLGVSQIVIIEWFSGVFGVGRHFVFSKGNRDPNLKPQHLKPGQLRWSQNDIFRRPVLSRRRCLDNAFNVELHETERCKLAFRVLNLIQCHIPFSDDNPHFYFLLCLLSRRLLWISLRICVGILHWKMGWFFVWSPFPTERSTRTPQKIRENSEQKFGAKFGRKFEKNGGELSFCNFSDQINSKIRSFITLHERIP